MDNIVLVLVLIILILIICCVAIFIKNKKTVSQKYEQDHVKELLEITKKQQAYIATQIEQEKAEKQAKIEQREIKKEQLAKYKSRKEQILEDLHNLEDSIDAVGLDRIYKIPDSDGAPGIYILHNTTKDKYYVGQAKNCVKRIKQHFNVEDIAVDQLNGDKIEYKIINASILPNDYNINHLEKALIEDYNNNFASYNKTKGNL